MKRMKIFINISHLHEYDKQQDSLNNALYIRDGDVFKQEHIVSHRWQLQQRYVSSFQWTLLNKREAFVEP